MRFRATLARGSRVYHHITNIRYETTLAFRIAGGTTMIIPQTFRPS